jgi:hypothetical protein
VIHVSRSTAELGRKEDDPAAGAAELTTAIAVDPDLAGVLKEECLALVQELSKQAALPKGKRSHRSVLQSVLPGLAAALSASGGWQRHGPRGASN